MTRRHAARVQPDYGLTSTPQAHLRDRHARGLRAARLRVFKCENSGRCALWFGSARLHGSLADSSHTSTPPAAVLSLSDRNFQPTISSAATDTLDWTANQTHGTGWQEPALCIPTNNNSAYPDNVPNKGSSPASGAGYLMSIIVSPDSQLALC